MRLLVVGLLLGLSSAVNAAEIFVSSGESIQAAIDAALPDDVVRVAPGEFLEDLDFGGKALRVVGAGPHTTVVRGTGAGPVVTFDDGEGGDSVLDSLTLTGGSATRGGGVYVSGASPTIVRCVIRENSASVAGTGLYADLASDARVFNSLIMFNTREGLGDPAALEVINAAPFLVNNTVVRNDSCGIRISGPVGPVIANNLVVDNGGKSKGEAPRGYGLCLVAGADGSPLVQNNGFSKNKLGMGFALDKKMKSAKTFEKKLADVPGVGGNLDVKPGFVRNAPKQVEDLSRLDFVLDTVMPGKPSKALFMGLPDAPCLNLDGTRNTLGWNGGPFAPGSNLVPDGSACGTSLADD